MRRRNKFSRKLRRINKLPRILRRRKKIGVNNTQAYKRSSDRLESVWRSKHNVGPGSTSVASFVVDEEPSMKKMRPWEEISRRMTQ